MTKLVWDQTGERLYETGTSQGVLFPMGSAGTYEAGVAWNGLIGVTQSPSGAEATALYANDNKYLELYSNEEFGGTITAYTYPDEFAACDGSAEIAQGVVAGQQDRKTFGMAYKTLIGNDTQGNSHGYKLHLIYGAKASPSEKSYSTVNDSPEAVEFSWEFTTTPVEVGTGFKPTSHIEIDSTKADPTKLTALETKLFGSTEPNGNATLPLPAEVITMMAVDAG